QVSVVPGRAYLLLDDPARESLATDDDLVRQTDEVGVGELDARARVAIVVEDVDTAFRQLAVQAVRDLDDIGRRVAATRQRDEVHVERRNRRGPCHAGL